MAVDDEEPDEDTLRISATVEKAQSLVTELENAGDTIKQCEGWSKFRRLVFAEYDAQCKKLAANRSGATNEGGVSNLPHLSAVWETVRNRNPTGIMKNISSSTYGRIRVDVTAIVDERPVWIKCVARAGGDNHELEDIAWAWLALARQFPMQGVEPLVCFRFFSGVPKSLSARLISMGVDADEGLVAPNLKTRAPVQSINLDSTTLIALISNLSHGHVGWLFDDAALEEQAAQESTMPVLTQLANTLGGKRLFCVPNVLATFRTIVKTIAGPKESARAEQLLSVIQEIEASPLAGISPSRSISARMLEIIGASVEHGMLTVTANGKAVRALANQAAGIHIVEHMARALTERKESVCARECNRQHCLLPRESSRLFQAIIGCDQEHLNEIAEAVEDHECIPEMVAEVSKPIDDESMSAEAAATSQNISSSEFEDIHLDLQKGTKRKR